MDKGIHLDTRYDWYLCSFPQNKASRDNGKGWYETILAAVAIASLLKNHFHFAHLPHQAGSGAIEQSAGLVQLKK